MIPCLCGASHPHPARPNVNIGSINRLTGKNMRMIPSVLVCVFVASLTACDSIPYHNTDHKPISIEADGKYFTTCGAYSMGDDSLFGEPSYELSFNDNSGAKVTLKGVRKLNITELPAMVDAPMPLSLPDPTTDRDSSGAPYREGLVYSWSDGSKAKLQDGKWVAVKIPNTICKDQ